VDYHVVYKRLSYNAINYLRNVALNHTFTPYALTLDVDLVPNPGLYQSIKQNLATLRNGSKEILVVPAFEAFVDPKEMPVVKPKLLALMDKKEIVGYSMNRSWNLGHRPTNYEQWKQAKQPYLVQFRDAFEPYVVVRSDLKMRYHEGLLERMGDKIAYCRHLHGEGYSFRVLSDDFLIHIPHAKSPDKLRELQDRNFFHCGAQFFEKFRKELYERYPNRTF